MGNKLQLTIKQYELICRYIERLLAEIVEDTILPEHFCYWETVLKKLRHRLAYPSICQDMEWTMFGLTGATL